MEIVQETENFIVIDDFLSQSDLEKVRDQLECETYNAIQYGVDKIYKLNSGPIYKSTNKYWMKKGAWENNFEPFRESFLSYIEKNTPHFWDKYSEISMMAHAYLPGAELSWHQDRGSAGGYTFFAHEKWHHMFGGNLLIASPGTHTKGQATRSAPLAGTNLKDSYGQQYGEKGVTFNHDQESEVLLTPGIGQFVAPKPNRLVLIDNCSFHKVERVDPAAGINSRVSLTGFLVNKTED